MLYVVIEYRDGTITEGAVSEAVWSGFMQRAVEADDDIATYRAMDENV